MARTNRLFGRLLLGPVVWSLLAYALFLAGYLFLGPGGPEERKRILDAGQTVIPFVAGVCCWLASRRAPGKAPEWSWRLFSVAYMALFVGRSLRAYYEVILREETPTPSVADLFYGLYYPLAFLGLVLQARWGRRATERATSALDALMFTMSAFGLSWAWILGPSMASAEDRLTGLIGVHGPLGDLLVTLGLISMMLGWPPERVPIPSLYLLVALLVQVYADTVHSLLVVSGQYERGNPVDALWAVSYAVAALAALKSMRTSSREGVGKPRATINLGWSAGLRLLLPCLSLAVALWLLLALAESPEGTPGGTVQALVAAGGVAVMLLIRHFITLVDNHRLSRSLGRLAGELEDRVAERTRELTRRTEELNQTVKELVCRTEGLKALNRVATGLSRCRTSEEVLSCGLEMACKATGMAAGAVWLLGFDGHSKLAACHENDASAGDLTADLPQDVPSLMKAVGTGHAVLLERDDQLMHAIAGPVARRLPSTLAAAPLASRESMVGVLAVMGGGDQKRRPPNLGLLEAIGAEIGVALESAQRYEHVAYLAERDPVTALLNHRAFHGRLQQEVKRHLRTGAPFSLLMMDIDGFKLLNETHGHAMGDQVLWEVAGVLTETARETDVVARYGDDEYSAILPETPVDGSLVFAKRVRAALAEHPFVGSEGDRVPVHLSFGVATFPEDGQNSHELVGAACTNLHISREKGGDTVTTAGNAVAREVAKVGAFGTLDGLITTVDRKDRYTRRHSEQVSGLSVSIADALGLSKETQRTLRMAGLLHDIGKIGVPDRVLRKPGRLDADEYAAVKQHALLGEMILKGIPNMAEVSAVIGAHHERYDGKGYPRGLKQAEIPLLGRILAVADAYSAMTTDRPYRQALSAEKARAELRRVSGTQLDPVVVEAFLASGLGEGTAEDSAAGK